MNRNCRNFEKNTGGTQEYNKGSNRNMKSWEKKAEMKRLAKERG